MNQKKHLNAIAALEASADAEPGSVWRCMYCHIQECTKCYVNGDYVCFDKHNGKTVSEVRAALQSGLDAYHKRKAEKAERRAAEAAIPFTRDPDAETKPLIPDPPDTPEVRAIMGYIASRAPEAPCTSFGCGRFGGSSYCPLTRMCGCGNNRQARHAFALSWLSRHPAVWDAEKGRFTLAERHARMRKWAEAVIKHYPIPDDDAATVWQAGMMDSRLLADEVIAYLADLKSGA